MNLAAAPRWLVTSDRVVELHQAGLALWGGAAGRENRACVESAIGNALSAAYYALEDDSDEPDPLRASAHMLVYLARDHCFADGNKRVAWMVFADQLATMGLHVDATNPEVVDLVLAVAQGKLSAELVFEWAVERLVALPDAPTA